MKGVNDSWQQPQQLPMSSTGEEEDHSMVMPGFRFHPTEEELIDFYLRRKVEGRRFNVELISFLDLYSYDPWELPALAAIGEKEWFFYVPRDRKYRNGDRPNRVTTSGYWKATGADRAVKNESGRQIGLKKTLVFYSGKAPKGIRSSWIMNEYRLPPGDANNHFPKVEICLCRVYKRPGAEDHPRAPGTALKLSSSRKIAADNSQPNNSQFSENSSPNPNDSQFRYQNSSKNPIEENTLIKQQSTGGCYSTTTLLSSSSNYMLAKKPRTIALQESSANSVASNTSNEEDNSTSTFAQKMGELNSLAGFNQMMNHMNTNPNHQFLHHFASQTTQLLPSNALPLPLPLPLPGNVSDKLWDWNQIMASNGLYTDHV
ncbi:NAC domain-containing protein 35-like [Zingiber officinale]|uniref:NAC domain-containing protein 35-like n=1 Tax=Zingiber officinale TaxID=94328 RepID=UPI001C4D26EA|nr:NAC domain-containing protein 35-like [Zingiber officinale]